jgi:FkbM family methyltransferase
MTSGVVLDRLDGVDSRANQFEQADIVEVQFAGKSFKLYSFDNTDQIATQIAGGSYEAPLPMLMMATLVRSEGAFLDVGANTGIYSIMASVIAPDRRVIAFEPLPNVLKSFWANLLVNGLENHVCVYETALSDRVGKATLHIPDPSHGLIETSASLEQEFKTASSEISVTVNTLDQMQFLPEVAVIKVDIEGHEYAFLRGAKETLNRDRPVVFAEVVGPARRNAMWALLNELGYMDFRLRPDLAIHDGEIMFDNMAWNHAFVPIERLTKFKEACDSCGVILLRRFNLT